MDFFLCGDHHHFFFLQYNYNLNCYIPCSLSAINAISSAKYFVFKKNVTYLILLPLNNLYRFLQTSVDTFRYQLGYIFKKKSNCKIKVMAY